MRTSQRQMTFAMLALAVGLGCVASAAGSSRTAAAPAKPVLNVGLPLAPASLDPAKNGTGAVSWVNQLAADTITYRRQDGRVTGKLATSFRYFGQGNKRFEFTLRRNARFSDGTPVTAGAVKTWLEYFKKTSSIFGSDLAIRSIETVGKYTVRLNLAAPNPVMPLILSQARQWGFVSSPNAVADPASLGVATYGAGPYTLLRSETVAGDHYTFVPNKFYYDKSAIKYSKVVLKVITNPSSMLAAMTTGQIDVAVGATSTADQAEAARLRVVRAGGTFNGLWLRDRGGVVSKPLGDVRVRQALNFAIDRKAITQAIIGKYGTPTSLPLTTDGMDPKLVNHYNYDPQKAKSLLAAAGYPNGFTVKVVDLGPGPHNDQFVQAVASYWDKIGVRAEITPAASLGDYIGKIVGGQYPINQLPQASIPMWLFYIQNLKPGSILNGYKYNDPEMTKAWLKGQRLSPDKARPLWLEISRRVVTQAWLVPVYDFDTIFFVSKKIGGFDFKQNGLFPDPTTWFPN